LDGAQHYLAMGALRDAEGRWWVYVGGKGSANALGYYPANWWPTGAAIRTAASRCEWGGENSFDALDDGTVNQPWIGSGRYADKGWRKSAYVRDIHYYTGPTSMVIPPQPSNSGTASATTPGQFHQKAIYQNEGFTTQVNGYASPWKLTLWYGGPGSTWSADNIITLKPEQ
jgi:hypothetical protein